MKSKINGNGCVALYYETMFEMLYSQGRKMNSDNKATADKMTVDSLLETMDDSIKPLADALDPYCKEDGKGLPCTNINDAIFTCAKEGGEKEIPEPFTRLTSKVEKTDTFGAVTKGGVKCWQGSNCH